MAALGELDLDVAPAGELGDEDTAVVADLGRFDVLVVHRVFDDGRHVIASLVGEGRRADVGRESVHGQVGQFGDEPGRGGDLAQLMVLDDSNAHLELQVGDDRGQVGVAAALSVAVETALDLLDAGLYCGQRVGDGEVTVVVRVNAQPGIGQHLADGADRSGDLVGHRAAVGVAENQVLRTGSVGGADDVKRVVGVFLEAIEEVLGVEVDLASDRGHVLDRLADHRQVLFT